VEQDAEYAATTAESDATDAKNKIEAEWHKKWSLQLTQIVADAEQHIKKGATKAEDAAKDVGNKVEEEWHKHKPW